MTDEENGSNTEVNLTILERSKRFVLYIGVYQITCIRIKWAEFTLSRGFLSF